jgi:hypothetical protein
VQSSGKDKTLNNIEKPFSINKRNPEYSKSLESLPKKIRDEVRRIEEQELMVNPFPRPDRRLIVRLESKGKYMDVYRVMVARRYRYVYRVDGTTVHSRYVRLRTNDTYTDAFL